MQQLTTIKKTLVLGASPNPARVSHTAVHKLQSRGHEVVALGVRDGNIDGVDIQLGRPQLNDIHTVSLYLNPQRQEAYYDYILQMQPERLVFNPGTENPELMKLARDNDIEVSVGCMLVMLAVGNF